MTQEAISPLRQRTIEDMTVRNFASETQPIAPARKSTGIDFFLHRPDGRYHQNPSSLRALHQFTLVVQKFARLQSSGS